MMSKTIILVFSLFGLLSACVGQYVQFGQCNPNVQLVNNFELQRFLGTWHELRRADNPNQGGECASFQFTNTNNVLGAYYSSVNNNFLQDGRGTFTQDSNTAKLKLSIPTFQNPIDFWVQLTDYESFALAFSCENISNTQRRIHIWVLGRETSFTGAMVWPLITTQIRTTFDIDANTLRTIDHSADSCHILPVIQPGRPIILPGRCDPNIRAVPNFNVANFLGVWHQIQSYYSPNSDGVCARAEYTLGNGIVNVLNSQVVNQTLLTIDGTASVSSTDNSAKLSVILNIPGVPQQQQDLWILATDYNTYAISYSCVQTSPTEKQVFSWILSRSRQLPQSSQAAVDQAVNSYLDLNYQYYKETDQSDAGCFYYPEPAANTPVVFRGQCQSVNVQAVSNFDANRYEGLWHTIQMYPSQFQGGTCSNAFYELIDGRIRVRNSNVVNQALQTVNLVGVPSSDGSAKLVVSFPGDTTSTFDYWVLGTDYTNYALVYTCRNLNADTMQVGSWKLSRTKQLTQNSVTAINAIINSVSVLDQRYYEVMSQTVDSCFYFPEPQAGVPVVFPGQCDPNVAVVQNFNFAQFAGEWNEIEAYPKAEQTGQCINHRYTFVDNNRLNLVSSSVTDQFLGVTNGVVTRSTFTDSSGRLSITIPDPNIPGGSITIPFWILSTDYNNYAFAYACVNTNQDHRRVWSWKLSRTKQLSAAATTSINNVIATNVVLDNRYFENIDQSDNACSYLPEIERGQPIILPGQCDTTIRGVPNFNTTWYAGRWRLIESYGSDHQQGTCNVARYTQQSANSLSVTNSQVVNGQLASITGTATVSSTDGSGKLLFVFPNGNFEVTILDTDYESYSLGYGCVNLDNNRRRIYSWKMSRDNTLSQTANNNMNRIIQSIQVLNNRYYYTVDRSQTGCFYYPTPDPNVNVRFRGQCNQNIPVVTNFQPDRYLGLWHDIESYPGNFQTGTCNNAYYSPGTTANVDVLNTQVINQTLATIRGTANLDPSTDQSAKLTVTFNVGGTNVVSNYWIVATDYTSYSLVYSCRPIDDEYVQVTSWKLSRTKTLTPAAVTAINNAMNNIPVLDQRYFIARRHSAADCFYFPEPQPGVQVVFPGQCDNTIAAVPNFNMNQFQGTWHEIEAYPKDDQPGQCVNHQFTLSGNTMNLQSSSVNNQALGVTTSTVRSTDGSGRLIITTTSNTGGVVEIPYWILSTDYNNYALAYSCVNINSDFRGIWSWKLSRTKQLSAASNTAINNAIANINVLSNEYYEPIQQTDNACFYLPNLGPRDPVEFPGQCDPNIRVIQNFNTSQYLGRWRLIQSYYSQFQEGTCNTATYSAAADGSVIVQNSKVVNQQLEDIIGSAVLASNDGSGKLRVTLPSSPTPMELWILDTDYTSYSLMYSCANLPNNRRRVWSWKMSRTNVLSANANNAINQIVNTINVLNARYYQTIDRSEAGCFYYPTPNPNVNVKFRGQCNQNIPVVRNFQPNRYLGLWHDIESYPGNFQTGTCNNAYYSPGTTADVDVFNTQVINQTLATIRGTANLDPSTDQSAKLTVTFNVGGTNVVSNYWIVATDYTSYSLVYSCRPIDDEYVQVTSWKLSRTKTLTPAAVTAINNAMSNIPVLDQRYFIARRHSAADCFYFPEPQPGVQVVFPGQCDNTIAAVPNFNMNQFQGTWHEIEAYPKDDQPGQCVNHQFTLSGNTMNLQSSSVNNQALGVTTSTVRSTDGSGRLIITTTSNTGGVVEIPYWILSTDYNNYALAYSCVNINSDFRGIWSWKLSRTKQLSAASNTAINNAIANINVLSNEYYEPIQQTDNACFYLPNLGPRDPVEFPGQCDPNIRVIQNFNTSQYLGRWRLIQSYYSQFQEGTCNTATYSAAADGSVIVQNSKVVNQQLEDIIGSAVLASNDGSGKLRVTLPSSPTPMELWILDTDYTSYSLMYSCANLPNNRRRVWSWKMSRTNVLSANANNAINQIVNTINVLNARYYQTIDRSEAGCFYYPTPNPNVNVKFRGQCNQNIPVVRNFQPNRYLGLWHDIESYPGNFQTGTCNNAYYSPGTTADVDVFNTQVINQTLATIRGTANLDPSTDQSAKLTVTFNVGGTNVVSNYWIVATDYTSYSLVYSCRPIDDEYVQVTSWKLSRTKTLTPAAVTAINNAMSNIPVLDQRYFIARRHSAADCFYFPEPQPGVQVVFPGQCDNTIAAVPNFNMNQFQGTWHEIEAYPKDDQPGQCVNHQFTLSGNTMNLQSSSVNNQALGVTTSTVRSTDGSGRLIITTTSNTGGVVEIPYWILSTDYNNYALAYSCVNINSDFRGIWSWKLSRTKQLSAASNTAINNAIANINVLSNEYYEPIQQTDNACFYLPNLGPRDPVEFPGQCDPNIRVIQNFNTSQYLGRWRLIQSYYSQFQEGTCNTATYSAAADGSVIVQNSKVVNQQLEDIIGSAVLASNDGSGKLRVTLPSSPTPVELWILDTDYTSYSLMYSCANLPNNRRRVWSWKMSRTNVLSANANNAINQIVNTINVLNARYYQTIDRSAAGCFYFPTPGSGTNVVFPGQCDQTIPVVTNFNANAYQGTWYDVESYPTNFQSGTCNTATYSLNSNGSIDVQNTQVSGQVLQTTTGTAVPSTNDGSAKLDVTFVLSSGLVTTKYWVLATDYTTYSLVYSCRNIDDEFRAVYSWKLSRQRSLPAAANTPINNVINSIQVLDQRYYVRRQHTDEACFYYPDNNGGDVILNGQCVADAQVPAITNFNANLFAGTWHEVARFPSTLQNGECTATQYTLSGTNTFNIQQTSVINEALLTTTTQAGVVTSTNGRGVLNINVNGVPFNNVYILATDYNEYALAYGCRNLDVNRKQIYSWKLSRSRAGLSDAANRVIDQLVTNNIDLFEAYYRYTFQDDYACFYYPVFDQLPARIELPGPCNTTIRGIPNFNTAAYLGRWFDTARYPQTAQRGQCNRAEYGSLPGGGISVVNSQVTNEILGSISGQAIQNSDGSGLFEVVLVVSGETRRSNYYVLATDYNNYALVYSCANLPNGNRHVGSWKLSRTRTLSQQALAIMTPIIKQTQGLTDQYYQPTSQSDESCFYVPPVDTNRAPVFRGQCEEITGVAGFNAQRYLGWWHEIERYPSDIDVGECISSRYEASGNVINVVDTSIYNLSDKTVRTTVTITNNGRIRRTLSGNRVQDTWVLATDYENYALLYSCENINNEYRRVWSAKHSKARSLTPAAQQAMNVVIQNNKVLHPQFYQAVDQSDDACFHYPIQTGPQVILRGQCDTAIPVVQSFNMESFEGTWYHLQRYKAANGSSCVGNRLNYNAGSGDIKVLAFEVINGELQTREGTGRLGSTDGSGRLNLVMPVGNSEETTEHTLYILATDYENYALAYSCVNIDPFHRQVNAWQLSRGRTLSAASSTAINAVIARRPELHIPYFVPIPQDEDCPEPSSAFLFKSSIIVILVCALLQLIR